MKRSVLLCAVAMVTFGVFACGAWAQELRPTPAGRMPAPSTQACPTTPEMWFYEQYRSDYLNPETMVRHKAQIRTQQRIARLESQKWFGVSIARPTWASDPIHADGGVRWVGNSANYPNRWVGVGGTTIYNTQWSLSNILP